MCTLHMGGVLYGGQVDLRMSVALSQ